MGEKKKQKRVELPCGNGAAPFIKTGRLMGDSSRAETCARLESRACVRPPPPPPKKEDLEVCVALPWVSLKVVVASL